MTQADRRPTVSIMKAAEIVGVSRRTIYNWIQAGRLEHVRTAGGSVRIFEDSLWRPAQKQASTETGGVDRSSD